MKKTTFMAVACLGFGIGFARAQSMDMVRVNLPFAARVGGVSLPAGEYSIHELSTSLVKISSVKAHGAAAFAYVTPIYAANHQGLQHTKIILRQDGRGYQFQSIWVEGQDMGFELNNPNK